MVGKEAELENKPLKFLMVVPPHSHDKEKGAQWTLAVCGKVCLRVR